MERKLFLGVMIGLLVGSILLAGPLEPAFAADAAPQTIKVGVMISLTGPDFQTGGPAKLGYELAVDEINKAGGVMVKA